MKQSIRWAITVALVAALVLFSKEVLNQDVTLVQVVTLFGIISLLKYLINIENTVNYLKSANDMQYDEYEQDMAEVKQKLHYLVINISDSNRILNERNKPSIFEKEDDDQSLPSFIDLRKKADKLKVQASSEESDSKAYGLITKAHREENLARAIENGLIARIGLFYKTSWDNKQNCLRIENYGSTGKLAIFYPKSDKVNYNGKWFEHGAALLEKELSTLQSSTENDAE